MTSNHRGPTRRATLAAAFVLALAVATASCGGDDAQTRDRAETAPDPAGADAPTELRDRTFVSTAVIENGEPQTLFAEAHVKVTFEERDRYDVVRWRARCNTLGARVVLTADRLGLSKIYATHIGCPGERQEQDEWLGRFFDTDPRWSMSDDRLMLASGGAVIELEAHRR